jgi:outer membrane lipase/esterase
MKPFGPVAALLATTFLVASGSSLAADFDQFIAFGDSTLDSGYFRYNPTGNAAIDQAVVAAVAHGAKGGFAGNGVMNTTLLAERFGLNAEAVGNGGTNFANGGAHTVTDVLPNVPTVQQIKNYLTSVHSVANPRGLYVLGTGSNDLLYVSRQNEVWLAAHPTYLNDLISTLSTEVSALQTAGARTILVPSPYTSAVYAGPGGVVPAQFAAVYAQSVAFGPALWSGLTAAGVRYIPADINGVLRYVVTHPTLFGFTAESVLAANPASPVNALVSVVTPAQMQSHLFLDGLHFTTAGQTIKADYYYSLLTAPSLISLVAESAVQSGLARTASLQTQIGYSGQTRAPRSRNAWFAAGANSLRLKNAPGFPRISAHPFGGTVGVDYSTSGGMLLGAALTAGGQRQQFSTGGHCNQVDEAVSLYVATKAGHWWGDAVATAGLMQDSIARQVPLGIFTDRNRADTDGKSLSLALRGGRDFHLGSITTGPMVGAVLQQVHLDGFTETGTSGVTALAFGGQTRDARIGQLGWRAAVDAGNWRIFADASWNHDWADRNRAVSAALTTVATAPFTADAAPVSADWGTATLGTSYRFNSRTTFRATATVVLGNPQVTSYGGELGLIFGF